MHLNEQIKNKAYIPSSDRYTQMQYKRCGKSGILLPAISLGLWHNFGFTDSFENARNILKKAFDLGITHIDLANNYGPPYGAAEENFGKILRKDFSAYRDELFIATKAGYDMWEGPYGNWGSKKYLTASLDQSLVRMKLDYVDVFYHHRPDPDTPLEETVHALDLLVKQGKALYIGISRYSSEDTLKASKMFKELGTPCIIHQAKYSMFERELATNTLDAICQAEMGSIVFSPLAQGLLTDKYLNGIPPQSRATKSQYLKEEYVHTHLSKIKKLHSIAQQRGQKLAQMAIAWILNDERITSVLLGASSPKQLEENVKALAHLSFEKDELKAIEDVLNE